MLERITSRWIYVGVAALCAGLMAFALYLQHARGIEPCPLCTLQRVAYVATGIIALIGLASPAAARSRWLPVALAFPVLGGLVVAGRHVWIEHFPVPSRECGAQDLGYLTQVLPLGKLLPAIFRGTGDCSVVQWRFLGLSIAEWSLVFFVILLAVAVMLLLRARRVRGVAAGA